MEDELNPARSETLHIQMPVFVEELSSSQQAEESLRIDIKKDENDDAFIEVSCGAMLGKLNLASLRKLVGGKGHEKCIFLKDNDKRVTPQEFEALGGKKSSRAWKKSIKHNNKMLSKFFSAGLIQEHEAVSASSMGSLFDDLESKLTISITKLVRFAIFSLK